jgi:hypothetical protein
LARPIPGFVYLAGWSLDVLHRHVADESVDLVYLDPPFKSNQDYNVLFADQDGARSTAQIKAFEDTWHWDQSAAAAYDEVDSGGGRVADATSAPAPLEWLRSSLAVAQGLAAHALVVIDSLHGWAASVAPPELGE